jgi:hypothetical protein
VNTNIRFLHPITRLSVTRVLCPGHHATARAMCDGVDPLGGTWADCDWCKPGDRLRARVAREFFQAGLATA